MATGRLALLAGLAAAGLSALLAAGAGVTETEMLLRAGLGFIIFALLSKAVATLVVNLVPEVSAAARDGKAAGAEARPKGAAREGSPGAPAQVAGPAGGAQSAAAPGDRGGRLNVVVPGTSAEEVLKAGAGKGVAG
ncbi:MAG: hypothetical protein ACYC9Q_00025 [Bacillota bacterium]